MDPYRLSTALNTATDDDALGVETHYAVDTRPQCK
jgi:hypothetical protein